MKRTLVLAIVLFVLGGALAAQQQTDLQKNDLHGDVKSVTETDYEAKEMFGEWVQGDILTQWINEYNLKGYIVKLDCFFYTSSQELLYEFYFRYKFNNNNKMIELVEYDADGLLTSKSIYTYNDRGDINEYAAYDADGSLEYKTIKTYDDKGNITEKFYAADGSLTSRWVYTYNDKGDETKSSFTADGLLEYKTIITYDDKGSITENIRYNTDGVQISKQVYSYDARGNKTEEASYDTTDSLIRKSLYIYDNRGNMIEEVILDSNELVESKEIYSYEYDMNDNWVKKIWSREVTKFGKTYPEPQSITIRDITYF